MMKVQWANSAIGDLAGIYAHIAQDSPRFALRVVDRITQRTKQLAAFPYSGQVVPEYNRDEVREVIEYSYRLIYILETKSSMWSRSFMVPGRSLTAQWKLADNEDVHQSTRTDDSSMVTSAVLAFDYRNN